MGSRVIIGHIYAFLIIVIWGMTFISSKILLKDFNPVEILFDRFFLATAILCAVYPKALKFVSFKVELYSALVGLFGITLYFVFENNALIYSNAANVSLIVSTAPIFVGLLNYFIDKDDRPTLNFYLGFAVAIAGIFFLTFGSVSLNLNPLGDLLAVGSALVWGLYSLYVVKLQQLNISSLTITIKSFFYSVILTLPLMVGDYSIKPESLLEPVNLINLMFLAFVASSLSFFLWSKSIEYIGSIKTNVYLYAIPVVTAVGALFILKEKFTIYTAVGMVLAIGGLVISQIKKKNRENR